MKFTIVFLLIVTAPFAPIVANTDKEYKKLIEKFDVPDTVKSINGITTRTFWALTLNGNELFKKFLKDINKKSGSAKEALRKTAEISYYSPQYDPFVLDSWQGFCDTILIDMGVVSRRLHCSLHVVESQEVNAFTILKETGFAICLTTGLLDKKGLNYNILLGYVAHEFAHGALCHHVRNFYAEAKARRKNELLGKFSAGLWALSAASNLYFATKGAVTTSTEEENKIDYGAVMQHIQDDTKIRTLKYSFKFSREEEYEADLIAFRFLESQGLGEEYINGLRILGTDYDRLYDDYSDHPTTASRIDFLKFVKAHPELGNQQNKKLKKL